MEATLPAHELTSFNCLPGNLVVFFLKKFIIRKCRAFSIFWGSLDGRGRGFNGSSHFRGAENIMLNASGYSFVDSNLLEVAHEEAFCLQMDFDDVLCQKRKFLAGGNP